MGMGIKLKCEHCGWESTELLAGGGLHFPDQERALREKIEKSTDPELTGARQALADHPDTCAATQRRFFQCSRCHRIKEFTDLSIEPADNVYPPISRLDEPKPPYWEYEPKCSGFFCKGRMSRGIKQCPRCGSNQLSLEPTCTMWD